ncbi:MAG: AtpZ/AtpI family protein [Roseinatronobacter sp.]|jgi:ATP synthase protein I
MSLSNPNDLERAQRLDALDAKIAKMKARLDPPKAAQDHHSMAQLGWRMVTELVAGLGIGAAFGYGLDVFIGTSPLFLIVLTLLGFAAGVKAMLRSAREFETKSQAGPVAAAAQKEDDASGRG